MAQGKRDATELSAAVEAGIRKGLDLVDAFRGTPAGRRELEREAKRTAALARKERRAYQTRKVQSQVMTIGGTAVGHWQFKGAAPETCHVDQAGFQGCTD